MVPLTWLTNLGTWADVTKVFITISCLLCYISNYFNGPNVAELVRLIEQQSMLLLQYVDCRWFKARWKMSRVPSPTQNAKRIHLLHVPFISVILLAFACFYFCISIYPIFSSLRAYWF